MSNLRNTQIGSFILFKVRRKSTGLFFKPEYRNPKWEPGGRAYSTLSAAMAATKSARERDGQGGTTLVPSSDIEIVKFKGFVRDCPSFPWYQLDVHEDSEMYDLSNARWEWNAASWRKRH